MILMFKMSAFQQIKLHPIWTSFGRSNQPLNPWCQNCPVRPEEARFCLIHNLSYMRG